jgi:hypothetical protein
MSPRQVWAGLKVSPCISTKVGGPEKPVTLKVTSRFVVAGTPQPAGPSGIAPKPVPAKVAAGAVFSLTLALVVLNEAPYHNPKAVRLKTVMENNNDRNDSLVFDKDISKFPPQKLEQLFCF